MQRKDTKGGILHYNVGSQLKYYTELRIMIESMAKDVVSQILELFKKPFSKKFFKSVTANDESISSQARIKLNALTKKYEKLFASKAKKISESMVFNQQKLSQFNVKKSVEKVYPDVVIKGNLVTPDMEDIMRASIEANVELINSVPSNYMKDITGEVMRAITTGYGEQDIRLALEKYEGISKRKAKEIAQDQMRKAYTAANIQNIKELGMNKFCWVHSGGGQFPRESHVKMDGMIFSLDGAELIKEQAKLGVKPKDQGFPGYPVNCGCIMQAVH